MILRMGDQSFGFIGHAGDAIEVCVDLTDRPGHPPVVLTDDTVEELRDLLLKADWKGESVYLLDIGAGWRKLVAGLVPPAPAEVPASMPPPEPVLPDTEVRQTESGVVFITPRDLKAEAAQERADERADDAADERAEDREEAAKQAEGGRADKN